jgi:hypothetical protein
MRKAFDYLVGAVGEGKVGWDNSIKAIEEAQIGAYNQALEDAVESAEVEGSIGWHNDRGYESHKPIRVNKQSILKLKKQ